MDINPMEPKKFAQQQPLELAVDLQPKQGVRICGLGKEELEAWFLDQLPVDVREALMDHWKGATRSAAVVTQADLEVKWLSFADEEVKATGRPRTFLVYPSGPVNARLAIQLH